MYVRDVDNVELEAFRVSIRNWYENLVMPYFTAHINILNSLAQFFSQDFFTVYFYTFIAITCSVLILCVAIPLQL